jgi:hypothetical protein
MLVEPNLIGTIISPIARIMMRRRLRLLNSLIRGYVTRN